MGTEGQKIRVTDGLPSTGLILQVLAVFSCAYGLRYLIWQRFPHVVFLHEADGIGYINIARNILEAGNINSAIHFPPFYPAVIALFASLAGNYETGARLASIFMGSIAVVPFYLVCRHLMGNRGGLYAAVIAAAFGPFIDYAVQPISQSTYLALIITGVWLGIKLNVTMSARYAMAFGLSAAALYLTRPEGILFFVVNMPVLAWSVYRSGVSRKNKFQLLSALCLGFGIPVFLYMHELRNLTGHWALSGKSAITIIGVDAGLKLLPDGKTYAESVAASTGLSALVPSLSALLQTCLGQAAKFYQATLPLFPLFSLPVALLGMLLLWVAVFRARKGERAAAFSGRYLFFSPLLMMLPVFAFDKLSISMGYVFPFFPVFIACFAQGAVWLEGTMVGGISRLIPFFSRYSRFVALGAVPVVFLMWFTFISFYHEVSSDEFSYMIEQQDFLLRRTGHWLRDNIAKDAKFMARWGVIGYYADRSWTGLTDGTIPQVVEYARRNKVDYIVIDSDAVPRRRPQLIDLLDPDKPQAGLSPVYAQEQNYTRVIIYRVQ